MDFNNQYKVNISQIRKEYPNFKEYGDNWMLEIYSQICEEQLIKEFINQTIPTNKTIEIFKERFKNKYSNIEKIGHEKFKISLNKIINNQFLNIKDINNFVESFGWFISKINGFPFSEKDLKHFIFNSNTIELEFEPRYDLEITTVEDKIYHLTFDIFWDKIKDIGLTPKNKSKISNHPERIYFVEKYNEKEFDRLSNFLYKTLPPDTRELIEKCYLLEIDARLLIENKKTKFYKDPNYSLGIWTFENIPPVYINEIKEIKIK
jgi:hypothetical protein